jgi:hypothetical protein
MIVAVGHPASRGCPEHGTPSHGTYIRVSYNAWLRSNLLKVSYRPDQDVRGGGDDGTRTRGPLLAKWHGLSGLPTWEFAGRGRAVRALLGCREILELPAPREFTRS